MIVPVDGSLNVRSADFRYAVVPGAFPFAVT
jgi:hypothetical protein